MKRFYQHIAKIFLIMVFCMKIAPPAQASGFAFNWEPFIVDEMLGAENPRRGVFKINSYVSSMNTLKNNHVVVHKLSDNHDASFDQTNEKKSLLKNIKITIFPDDMTEEINVIYPYSDDERTAKLIRAITSLIYDDSKLKSLETIGKIVEPQIKLYFEF